MKTNNQNPLYIELASPPLYMSSKELSGYLGIGQKYIEECLHRTVDPLPHLLIGTHRKVNYERAVEYFKRYELGGTA